MRRASRRPSPTWRAFLAAHRHDIAAVDFFVVPTLTFRLLFGFVILRHDRRELLHIGVTDQPTAAWAAQQIVHAVPDETGPAYLLRDRELSTALTSSAGSSAWAFARSSSHLALPGRIPSPSASSARFAANASISSSCSTNATCVACFATSCTTTLRGLTRVSVTTVHAGARYRRSHPGVSSQSRGRRASSPLPTRGLTARGPRLPAPPRSSVQAGLSGSIPSSGAAAGVGVRVGSGANLLGAYTKRFAGTDHLFDRDSACRGQSPLRASAPDQDLGVALAAQELDGRTLTAALDHEREA